MRVEYNTFNLKDKEFYSVEVNLPKTSLLVVGNSNGYFMCGALDVGIFDSNLKLKQREVICGRSVGVRTIDQLIESRLESVTEATTKKGIISGMKVSEALLLL